MSTLAKIFVLFVLFLSLTFFGTSVTLFKTRQDYKVALGNYQKETQAELKKLQDHTKTITDSLDEKVRTIDQQKAALTSLGVDLKRLTEEVGKEKTAVSVARKQAEQANVTAEQSARTATTLTERNKELEGEKLKSQGDAEAAKTIAADARKERDSIRLDLENVQRELHALKVEHTDLVGKFDSLQLVAAAYEKIHGPYTGQLAPAIDALVSAVDAQEKLVVLSVGRDDKVESGFEFTVYRGDEYVGKVKVIKVYPNLSGAKILFTKDGQEIQRGDKASTSVGVN